MHSPSAQPGPPGPRDVVVEAVHGAPAWCLRQRPRSVLDALVQRLADSPDSVLLVDPAPSTGPAGSSGGRTLSAAAFADLVEGAAARLRAEDVPAGAVVATLARNGAAAAVAIWAAARAGAVHLGIPVDAPAARVADLLALTRPLLLHVDPEFVDLATAAVRNLPAGARPQLRPAEAWLSAARPFDRSAALPDQDTVYALIPTSGTTGRPKAVQVTGRMAGHAAAFYVRALGLLPTDRTAIHLPFSWVSGHLTQLTPALLSGGSAVTLAHYRPELLLAAVREHQVTWLDVVPSIWEGLLRQQRFALPELAGVRLAVFGGAPAPPGTLDRVRARLPHLRLHDVYALSETCAPLTHLPDAESARRAGTVGRAVSYAEVQVVDPGTGAPRAPGEAGEVWARTGSLTPGYVGGRDELRRTADGWLRTGDLGRLDPEGYLTMLGRVVDLIVRGGVNIYPEEVERALLNTGQVLDAAAVGVPSAVAGQTVAAVVSPRPGAPLDVAGLQQAVAAAVGRHAVPRPLLAVAEVPRSPNGKLDRAAALALLQPAAGGSPTPPDRTRRAAPGPDRQDEQP